ncbi:hypothetical protein CSUI_007696, partial [Cystoisospora suis]
HEEEAEEEVEVNDGILCKGLTKRRLGRNRIEERVFRVEKFFFSNLLPCSFLTTCPVVATVSLLVHRGIVLCFSLSFSSFFLSFLFHLYVSLCLVSF